MATVTLKGNPVKLKGELPHPGDKAPDATLVTGDLSEKHLSDFRGKAIVLNIFPSIDTGVCALQTKTFAQRLKGRDDVVAVFASMDLPFALGRFCASEGLDNAVTGSDFRYHQLAERYGVGIADGPLAGLCARATLVIDADQTVQYVQLVEEITEEPDYDAALAALDAL